MANVNGLEDNKKKSGDGVDDKNMCPCGDTKKKEWIECMNPPCGQWLHRSCVGLAGLTEAATKKLTSWHCPECFFSISGGYFALSLHRKGKSTGEQSTSLTTDCTTQMIIREELHKMQPVIAAVTENAATKAVTAALLGKVASKVDVEMAVKSYAKTAQEHQAEVLKQAAQIHSAKGVADQVVRQLDTDKIIRERKKLNVVVMGVPESKAASAGQRKKDDYDFIYKELEMEKNEVVSCLRAGKKKEKINPGDPEPCRPLIIKMVDTDTVNYYTDGGYGYRTQGGYWINNDLCAADRLANFRLRQQRKERREQLKKQLATREGVSNQPLNSRK